MARSTVPPETSAAYPRHLSERCTRRLADDIPIATDTNEITCCTHEQQCSDYNSGVKAVIERQCN